MIITLSGLPGAGKSTLKDKLADVLQLKKYSVGDMRGKMALDRGMTIDELNELGMQEAFTDKEVDAFQEKLGQTEDNFVIDGWLSWYFIPNSLKIFVEVSLEEGARRIFDSRRQMASARADEPLYGSVEETKKAIMHRLEHSYARYKKWYGVDFLDRSHYDFVLDTTHLTEQEALQKTLDFIKSRS